jgi:hypothetical protein
MNSRSSSPRSIAVVLSLVALALYFRGCGTTPKAPTAAPAIAPTTEPTSAPTTEPAQATFSSPDLAVQAMVDALRANDDALLLTIFGPGGDQVISSGDDVADKNNRQKFLDWYDAKHEIDANDDGSETLAIGLEDWPMPIPIVNDGGVWRFDTQAGLQEILNRRIGKNELATIQVCKAIVDAQQDYLQRNPTGANLPEYAQKFLSDPGQKDGLYWPAAEGEPSSPLGPLLAAAEDEGYSIPFPPETPYHGYFYRILKSQGPEAQDGAFDYLVNGKMIGGFAIVAYPAQYGNSGIMTFIVNYHGVVYEKDLGDDTDSIAKEMTTFDPDSSWKADE